jgi:hypothetical protein
VIGTKEIVDGSKEIKTAKKYVFQAEQGVTAICSMMLQASVP